MLFKQWVVGAWSIFDRICIFLQPLGDLFIRCWVAKAFIASGLTKTSSWSSTLLLFQYEYQVPLLPPEMAAVLAVIIELGISAFLVLGLGGRIPALILFVFNIMAVVSYPVLWTPAGYTGLKDHICWGIVLLVILLHGTGKISLDQAVIWWWKRRHPV
ncbi:hypothetical protein AQUSIP_09470 [Aquicella siphonis]|uniref:DoxX family protein n=1 Tax=Aquicella siphonis TaxID=254247 RepID=A0A5E4PGS3_9COXI|nr:DoxX family protein [Aquicella siphonis]VVC75657.1 hypothetical protein AQUSIP_09470 [Aquicella siphonis]